MSVSLVRGELQRFLKSDDRIAVCLRGKWGVGKTHTWNSLLSEAFNDGTVKPARYSYVSLFGLETLGDVRRSLFENTVEAAAFKPNNKLKPTLASASDRVAQLASRWRAATAVVRGLPIIADYGGLAEKVGFLDVREQIICIDDLERMSSNLDLKDVFGLISDLKEKKKCKVILVLNSEMLSGVNAEDYRNQLEKVIDINLDFSPTPSEVAEIAIPDRAQKEMDWVATNVATLGITNIRTIYKILRITRRLKEILDGYDERILKQAIHSSCLYGLSIYQPHDAPPIDSIAEHKAYAHMFAKKPDRSPQEMRWAELLQRYGYGTTDPFDLQVLYGVQRGYFNESELKEAADNKSKEFALKDKDHSFSKAWDMYHDSFDNNGKEFADNLKKSIIENTPAISPGNLSASVAMLRKIGEADGVEKIVEHYVNSRDEPKEFWNANHFGLASQVEDPDVRSAFAEKAQQFADGRSLVTVLEKIVRTQGWNKDDLDFLDRHSEDDIFDLLKSLRQENLRTAVYGLTFFRNVDNADKIMQRITGKAVAALQRIGKESAINRCRVEKFGITVP